MAMQMLMKAQQSTMTMLCAAQEHLGLQKRCMLVKRRSGKFQNENWRGCDAYMSHPERLDCKYEVSKYLFCLNVRNISK